jgi:serine/threonine protein kinase
VAVQLYQSGEDGTSSTSIVRKEFNFDKSQSTLKLYKDRVLGVGAYGMVCEAKYGNFTCAAKFIYSLLKSDVKSERFQKECSLLRALRHPNIVQFFGVGQDPDSGDPVLLMEILDKDLTQTLKTYAGALPLHMEVNICHNVAQALAYLHSNRIVHCNLSSSHVLLVGSTLKAKICSFGSAIVLTVDSDKQHLDAFPGTILYMPPEAMTVDPKYNENLDSFSFGVLTVEILTRLVPQPHNRQDHIKKIALEHPLRKTALDCLEVKASLRPSAIRLCTTMEKIKESQAYQKSEALAATLGRQQIAPALTEYTSAQKLKIQDKPQVKRQPVITQYPPREGSNQLHDQGICFIFILIDTHLDSAWRCVLY